VTASVAKKKVFYDIDTRMSLKRQHEGMGHRQQRRTVVSFNNCFITTEENVFLQLFLEGATEKGILISHASFIN
jgi:hypothetical protein